MQKILLKIISSSILVFLVGVAVYKLMDYHQATSDGTIHLVLRDMDQNIVFEGDLSFETGDSFYDVLAKHFTLVCANGSYQPDETCTYTFNSFVYQGKVILGISGDDFELITNWSQTFLAFETFHDQDYVLSTQGPSHIAFKDNDKFRITVRSAWES